MSNRFSTCLSSFADAYMQIFEVPTRHFSSGDIPLVYQVLPALVEMKETLEVIRGATDISPVTRVGAQAALNVFDKYMANMTICEVYFIAIGKHNSLGLCCVFLTLTFAKSCVQMSNWTGFGNTTTAIR
jgi:hypothetical protein